MHLYLFHDAKKFQINSNLQKLIYVTGMHFSQAVSIIQSQVGTIRGVQVLYSDTVSFSKLFL